METKLKNGKTIIKGENGLDCYEVDEIVYSIQEITESDSFKKGRLLNEFDTYDSYKQEMVHYAIYEISFEEQNEEDDFVEQWERWIAFKIITDNNDSEVCDLNKICIPKQL